MILICKYYTLPYYIIKSNIILSIRLIFKEEKVSIEKIKLINLNGMQYI